jgi:hypothetical protein
VLLAVALLFGMVGVGREVAAEDHWCGRCN